MPAADGAARPLTGWRASIAAAVLVLGLLAGLVTGCSAGTPNGPRPSPAPTQSTPSQSTPSQSTPALSVPANGVRLVDMGFANGPGAWFSLPQTAVVTTRVDQPSAVTVVLAAPAPDALADYLRDALPAGGFTVTGDDGQSTLSFTGHGWTGDATGTGATAAVVLRPQ